MKINSSRSGVIIVYASLLVALFAGLTSSSLNAAALSMSDFGYFRYLQSWLSIGSVLLSLGAFSTLSVALVAPNRVNASLERLLSVVGVYVFVAGIFLSGLIFLVVSYSDFEISSRLEGAFLLFFIVFLPYSLLLQESFRARSDYFGLFFLNAAPPILFLFASVILRWYPSSQGWLSCLLCFVLSQSIVYLFLARRSGVSFDLKAVLDLPWMLKVNYGLGLRVYVASLFAALMAQVGIFFLQSISGSADVAVFSLAITLTLPLTMLPSAIGTVYFSKLANQNSFPRNVLLFAWLMSCIVFIFFVLVLPFLVDFLYGNKYKDVVGICYYCALGAILHGMGDVYNRYYLANGASLFLFYAALMSVAVSVIFSYLLIFYFSYLGASVARLLASTSYLLFFVFIYHISRIRYSA